MCYTGICIYENYHGECRGLKPGTYQGDAECMKDSEQIYDDYMEEIISDDRDARENDFMDS